MERTELKSRLLNDYQHGFPLESRPFARIADELGVGEDDVLDALGELGASGAVSRIGAVVRPNTVGASTLAAMAVPAARLDAVAAVVSRQPEVNHNYAREHEINLWFVITAPDPAGVRAAVGRIETETGLPVLDLPLLESFHIDLGFDMEEAPA